MKIGILQTGHAPEELQPCSRLHGYVPGLLHDQGFSFETYSIVDGIFPQSPEDADGWLITGSKHATYEDHDWIAPLETLIRDIAQTRRPLIGICFGHQIIAQALGGKVEKFSGGWAVGHQTYQFGGAPLSFNAWHQDQVTKRPEGAIVLASNDFARTPPCFMAIRSSRCSPTPNLTPPLSRASSRHADPALSPTISSKRPKTISTNQQPTKVLPTRWRISFVRSAQHE